MLKKILVIVPTRNRNQKSKEFAECFFANSKISDLLFGLDEDDETHYERISGALYEINPRLRLNGTLNLLAVKYANQYEYIAFMGDDHRIRTQGWDEILYEKIKSIPNAVAYGNDLIQKEKLPTAVIMDSNIITKLGFMSPPVLTHLYLDNFWKDVGSNLGTLTYFDDIIIEHMHYFRGKSEIDEIYAEVNSSKMKNQDKTAYENYKNTQFTLDMEKLK